MACPCCTYNKIKTVGPKGPIVVTRDVDKAIECMNGCAKEADIVDSKPDDDTLIVANS
jgi:hypothetical protein